MSFRKDFAAVGSAWTDPIFGKVLVFEFLKKGRGNLEAAGRRRAESSAANSPNSVPASTLQRQFSSQELTSVVLRDTLRVNGIPADWISCEVTPRPDSGGDRSLMIQLVIQRWHDGLLSYAPLLQQQLLMGLQRYDPASDHSAHVVVWKFSPNCAYPHATMPSPDFWSQKPALAAKPKFDLPPSDRDNLDDGFAPTEPGDWR
jgi:hypothetical protein